MDPTLYDEISRGLARARGAAVEIKPSLSLDLANFPLKRERVDGLLVGSCDLELPSPELERLLLQQAYETTTTTTDPGASGSLSTPTTQILFPKSVTEEQEAYARGFIDALEQLHRSQGAPVRVFGDDARHSSGLSDSVACNSVISTQPYSSLQNGVLPSHVSYVVKGGPSAAHSYSATIHHMATGQMSSSAPLHSGGAASSVPVSSAPFHSESSAQAHFHSLQMGALVEAPQTVPRLGDTPPLSPVNMDDQERIKLERKRARNRMAARKCRSRKLEQIATLEIRVNELKSQNAVLASSASTLKDEVDLLELQLREHTMSGLCYANPNVPGHV